MCKILQSVNIDPSFWHKTHFGFRILVCKLNRGNQGYSLSSKYTFTGWSGNIVRCHYCTGLYSIHHKLQYLTDNPVRYWACTRQCVHNDQLLFVYHDVSLCFPIQSLDFFFNRQHFLNTLYNFKFDNLFPLL